MGWFALPDKERERAKQPVYWFLGGMAAIIQQKTIVWVGSPSLRVREGEREEFMES